MSALLRHWNNYWFHTAPLIDLAICRIVVVAFQLFWMLKTGLLDGLYAHARLPDALYEPLPVLRLLTLPLGWNSRPPLELLEGVFWITLIAGILALIGLKTNFSLFVFAVGNLFMQAYLYSFGELHHPQALMLMTLLIFSFAPVGATLSIDDLSRRLLASSRKRRFAVYPILDESGSFARWPLLLVRWTFALVYLSAAVSKLTRAGLHWMNGYTLQYYLLLDGLRWESDFGVWLAQQFHLAWALSWISILFEGTFFLILIFPGLAWLYLPTGVVLHTGIYVAQRAPFFQFIAIYAVFVPWAAGFKALSHRWGFSAVRGRPEILFDGQCPLCIRSMSVVGYFDWFGRLAFTDFEEDWPRLARVYPGLSREDCRREMHVVLPDGSVQKGFFAFREIVRSLPPLWGLLPVVYSPLASRLGPKIYRFVADRRRRLQRCTNEACLIHPRQGQEV